MLARRRILSDARPISAAMKPWVARATERAGLATLPDCVAVGGTAGPGVLGIVSPVIVLPESLAASLSPAELESILIHECVHFRRRDTLWAGLQAVLGSLFWFNPVVWLLNRSVTVESEKACDEEVLEITSDPVAYAGGIMKAIRQALGLQLPGFAGAGTLPVLSRVQNILSHRPGPARRRATQIALGAALLVVALSGFSGALAQDAPGRAPGKVLVFRNIRSWNRHPDFEEVLGKLGFPFDVRRSRVMNGTDLSAYRVVVIPGAQWGTDYYQDFADASAVFDRYVQAGGTLVVEMNGAEREGMTLPGGATMVNHPSFNNLIVMPDHPALAPFAGKPVITADLASHGYLKDVPKDALVLAVEVTPNQVTPDASKPTYVEYAYGKGRVIAACQCFHDRDNSGRGPLMPAVLDYAMAGNWYSPK
jgi:hypothetical protein